MDNDKIIERTIAICHDKGKIQGIRFYREETGASLGTSKAVVDKLMGNNTIPSFSKELRDFNTEVKCPTPEYVLAVQKYVEKGVFQNTNDTKQAQANIFTVLEKYNTETIKSCLGDLGTSFIEFGSKIYKDHPALSDIQSGALVEGGKVFERVSDALEIGVFCKSKELKTMPKVIVDWLNRNHQKITKTMQKPPARFLFDEAREKQRKVSKVKEITLSNFHAGGKLAWDDIEENFIPYTRLGPGFSEIIAYTKKMKERCEALGLKSTTNSITKDVKDYEQRLNDKYCGFFPISLDEASIVLAKSMGAIWNPAINRVVIEAKQFHRKFWNCTKEKLDQDPYISDILDRHISIESTHRQMTLKEKQFNYCPRTYPIHDFAATKSEFVTRLLTALEAYPDCNGRPVFDQIWVVIPGIHQSSSIDNDQFKFNDGHKVHSFHDYWEYIRNLDVFLTNTKEITPIIMGENHSTKKCYFISYWN